MYRIGDFTSENIKEAFEEKKNVILPLGAIEAHSDHLPLSTDIVLAEDYANKLAEKTDSLVLPVIPFGQVWSLRDAAGSIHIQEENLVNFLVDILESLNRNNVKMVTMISSHFGNVNAMKAAARKVFEKHPIKVIYFTYPGISDVKHIFDHVNDHSFYLHADEIETSMMLHVKPEVVRMDKIREGTMEVPKEVDYTPVRWTEFTDTFIIGDAKMSTSEKGRLAFEHIIEEASRIILREKNKL